MSDGNMTSPSHFPYLVSVQFNSTVPAGVGVGFAGDSVENSVDIASDAVHRHNSCWWLAYWFFVGAVSNVEHGAS